jgi:predicted ATPase
LANYVRDQIYLFNAVRFPADEYDTGGNGELASDASNLAQVLDLLYRNKARWERFFDQVKQVLPQVEAVTFIPSSKEGGKVQARIWNLPESTERIDLTVLLSESGTGVAQVLAILYVVFTSDKPRIIIIDEPQSFLHPGAIRKLFEILNSYPQHQYIITTHSPTVVVAAGPSALFLIRKVTEESIVEPLDVSQN